VAVALIRERLGELGPPRGAPPTARLVDGSGRSNLDGREVVIVGTGETSELTARALAENGGHPVFVANRRRDRALDLARRYRGHSLRLDELPDALLEHDIVVAATASPHLLLEVREVAEVMEGRGGRPMLLIDLAVPRDIDAACAGLEGVTLADIDDLQAVADRNRNVRQAEARKAEGIIEEEIGRFATWLGSLEVLPTLTALRTHATEIAALVVAENAGKWETASPRDLERIDAMAQSVVNRLLHEPTVRMKGMRDDRVHARMALVRELFGLSTEGGTSAHTAPAPGSVAEVRELPSRSAAQGGARPA
jgi:glutamyl-tRNA reductase